jgi:hypothetical protein
LLVQLSGHGGGLKGAGALHATKTFSHAAVLGKHEPELKTSVLLVEALGHQIQFNCNARLIERHVEQLTVSFDEVKSTQVFGGGVTISEQLGPWKSPTQIQVSLTQTPFPEQNCPPLWQGGVKTEQSSPE